MVIHLVTAEDLNTQAEFDNYAELFAYGSIDFYSKPVVAASDGVHSLAISGDIISGNEPSGSLLFQDDADEKVLKGARTNDSQAGNWVVGFASESTIKKEMKNYQIFQTISMTSGSDTLFLYRGTLNVSATEAVSVAFDDTIHVQFIGKNY